MWDLDQDLRTKFIPNVDAEQRIETETSRKYYVDHEELWYDSEEKDKSTAGSLEFKALTENIMYRWFFFLKYSFCMLFKKERQVFLVCFSP